MLINMQLALTWAASITAALIIGPIVVWLAS